MNTTALCLLSLALALPQSVNGAPPRKPTSSPPSPIAEMTREQGFYYWVAVYGAPRDVVDRYATVFDAANYKQAMADEFERNRYRAAIQERISSKVNRLTFDEKYIYVTSIDPHKGAKFGEYSFTTQSFPVIQPNTGFSYFNYWVAGNGFDVNPFPLEMALNVKDFSWSLPMPEGQARTFLKNRPSRQLTLRIVYSVTKGKKDVHSRRYYLTPFIHVIEVFADAESTTPIGTLARESATPGSWRDANTLVAGQEKTFYKGRYRAYWGNGLTPSKFGELTSADGAEYYRIIDHRDGKILVKDYYISGELEMEGQYQPSCAKGKQCPDGVFTWYHKNRYKRQEETFVNGEESPYCTEHAVARFARMWDENGKCKPSSTKKCPCADQGAAEQTEAQEAIRPRSTTTEQLTGASPRTAASTPAAAPAGTRSSKERGLDLQSKSSTSAPEAAITPPEVESRVEAIYPEVARKARISGIVIVECVVDEQGTVVETKVLKPLPFGLDQAAVDAVRQWKFRPAHQGERLVKSTYEAVVTFRLGAAP